MDLTAFGGAVTIALASAVIFLLVVRSFFAVARTSTSTLFPQSIMLEAAQRFRDQYEDLGREQSVFLITGLVFCVVFCVFYLLPPRALFENVPHWQLYTVLVMLMAGAAFALYRLIRIVMDRRQLAFIRDASIATGHALQQLSSNRNRVFHDVQSVAGMLDHVVVGLHGAYTIGVCAKKPGKNNAATLNGDNLVFADSKEVLSVAKFGARSEQLAREFRKLTGNDIRVRPVVAVPGWEVTAQDSDQYLLVNERNIAMLTGWKNEKDYLMNEDVDAIHKMLAKRCKRFHKRK